MLSCDRNIYGWDVVGQLLSYDPRHLSCLLVLQLKRITLVDDRDIYCMWLSRDLDMERARTADLSMSMSRPTLHDPYGQHLVSFPHPQPYI